METPLKIGVVGCGQISKVHFDTLKTSPIKTEIAVCDAMPGKAEMIRKKNGFAASFTDFSTMLQSFCPDVVHILTPPQMHVSQTMECIKHGAHVLVEKPISLNASELQSLLEYAVQHNKKVCCNHTLLFQPSVQEVLTQIRRNRENVVFISCMYTIEIPESEQQKTQIPQWKKKLPGSLLLDSIVHPVTLAVELGGTPENITILENANDQNLTVCWAGENATVALKASTATKPFIRKTEIYTDNGLYVIDHGLELCIHQKNLPGPKIVNKIAGNISYSFQNVAGLFKTLFKTATGKLKDNPGTRNLIKEFYAGLSSDGPLPVTVQNMQMTTKVVEKIASHFSAVSDNHVAVSQIPVPERKSKNKRVVVTGASGYLGTKVALQLYQEGYEVDAIVRSEKSESVLPATIKRHYLDLGNPNLDTLKGLFTGAEAVVHCAHASDAKTWNQYLAVNTDASVTLYVQAAACQCPLFVFVSSISVYGMKSASEIKMEDDEIHVQKNRFNYYINSKVLAEKRLLEVSKTSSTKLVIARPGVLFGAQGEKTWKRSYKNGKSVYCMVFGSGNNVMPFTRVETVADFIVNVINKGYAGKQIFNLIGKQAMTLRQFSQNLYQGLGYDVRFIRIPAFPLKIMAAGLEAVAKITKSEKMPPISNYVVDSAIRNIKYDSSNAIECYGWDPVKAEDWK